MLRLYDLVEAAVDCGKSVMHLFAEAADLRGAPSLTIADIAVCGLSAIRRGRGDQSNVSRAAKTKDTERPCIRPLIQGVIKK
jgi:hypothetical protein